MKIKASLLLKYPNNHQSGNCGYRSDI